MLLIANVAFFAVPSADPGNQERTLVQLFGYFSTVASIGSIVIGLLLLRQHRTKPQDTADEAVSHCIRFHPYPLLIVFRVFPRQDGYLRSRYHSVFGFEPLAILYSLPYSLLLWS